MRTINSTQRDWIKGENMKYRVHQLEVKKDTAQERLERFLNQLEGEVQSIVPYISPTFQGMGATAKIDFLLIVEKIN
jgi:arsenate reductase-like glutaredoxin family protein